MPKALKVIFFIICIGVLPLYWWDAKLRGVWDSDGLFAIFGTFALVPVTYLIRWYFVRKWARKERERREREAAAERALQEEAKRKRIEREEAEAEADRQRKASEASETLRRRQKR